MAEQITKKSSSWFWPHLFKSIIYLHIAENITGIWLYIYIMIYVGIFLITDNEIWFDHLTV